MRPDTGEELHSETDFPGPGPKFERHYSSFGVFRPYQLFNTITSTSPGDYWSHTYHARVFALQNAWTAVRPNHQVKQFDASGWEIGAADGKRDRVQPGSNGGWLYVQSDGTREFFDSAGYLISIERIDGEVLTLRYTGSGASLRLQSVTDRRNRSLIFEHDALGYLASVAMPDGLSVDYTFNAIGNLTTVTYKDGAASQRQFLYEAAHPNLLTGIVDETNTRVATYEYEPGLGRLLSEKKANNVDYRTFEYSGLQTTVTDVETGAKSVFAGVNVAGTRRINGRSRSCPSCGGGQSASTTFDALGFTDVTTDFRGTVTDHDFNTRGLEVQRIEAKFNPEKRTIQTDWHPTFGVPTAHRTYDATGAHVGRSNWTHNSRGQVLTQTQVDPVTNATRNTTYTYCETADIAAPNSTCPLLGLLKTINGPRTDVADVLSYAYYPSDDASCASSPTTCPHRKGDLWKVTSALGHVSETLRYDGAGRVLSFKDANGVVTDFEYHNRGWITARKVRGANDGSEVDDAITRVEYWPHGLVRRVTQPDGDFLVYEYDAAQRLETIEDALGNRVEYTLDKSGHRTVEVTKDGAGAVKRQLSRVYDLLGQLDLEKNAAQQAIADHGYDANNNLTSTIDALGRETRQSYDPLNRLKQTIHDFGGLAVQTDFVYDALDRQTRVADPKGLNTDYGYDGLGNLRTLTSPDTGVTSYTPDAAGNVISQTDARGLVRNATYDAHNRLRTVSYPSAAILNSTFIYDTVNTACAIDERFALGRLTRMTDASGSTDYCYNRLGAVARKVQTIAINGTNHPLEIQYRYSLGGRLIESHVHAPRYLKTIWSRDGAGRIVGVRAEETWPCGGTCNVRKKFQLVSGASYLPFGPLAGLAWPNATSVTRVHDLDYQLTDITADDPGALSLSFEHDPLGNVEAVQSPPGGPEPRREYGYDALQRLEAVRDANQALLAGYTYDDTGNRLSRTEGGQTEAYVYPSTSHRLGSVAGTARGYDAAGNSTHTKSNKIFTYDARNRLVDFRTGPQANKIVARYQYNGRGERVRKTVGGVEILFLYDESGQLILEYEPAVTRFRSYVYLDGLPVGLVDSHNGTLAYALQPDHLGTPRAVLGPLVPETSGGGVVQMAMGTGVARRWQWPLTGSAFGEHAPTQDPDNDGMAFVLNLRYPGQYFDAESGLHYNYFRDYEPSTGRYLESDPIGLRGGIATFNYARGNSLLFIDPNGQNASLAACGLGPVGCVGGIVVAGVTLICMAQATQSVGEESGSTAEAAPEARELEHQAYKEVCHQKAPKNLSPCDLAKWKLNRNIQCKQMRIDWDNKWSPGRHANDIENLGTAIRRLENWIINNCGCCP